MAELTPGPRKLSVSAEVTTIKQLLLRPRGVSHKMLPRGMFVNNKLVGELNSNLIFARPKAVAS